MGVGSHALTEALSPPTAFYLSQAASPAYARLLHAGFSAYGKVCPNPFPRESIRKRPADHVEIAWR